jgi:hypothetical protein
LPSQAYFYLLLDRKSGAKTKSPPSVSSGGGLFEPLIAFCYVTRRQQRLNVPVPVDVVVVIRMARFWREVSMKQVLY